MKEKTKDKDFADYWRDLDNKIDLLEKSNDTDVTAIAAAIKNDLKELKSGVKGLKIAGFWLGLLSILLIIFFMLIGTNNRTIKKIISSDYDVTKDSILGITDEDATLHFETYKGSVLSYPKLLSMKDSIEVVNSTLKSDLELCQLKLKWAKEDSIINSHNMKRQGDLDKLYSEANEVLGKKVTKDYAKKVDSAMVLLSFFRKRMTYDKATNMWTIKAEK